jgi:hypothetical protein
VARLATPSQGVRQIAGPLTEGPGPTSSPGSLPASHVAGHCSPVGFDRQQAQPTRQHKSFTKYQKRCAAGTSFLINDLTTARATRQHKSFTKYQKRRVAGARTRATRATKIRNKPSHHYTVQVSSFHHEALFFDKNRWEQFVLADFLSARKYKWSPDIKAVPSFEISLSPGGFHLLRQQAARFSRRRHRRERCLVGPALIAGADLGLCARCSIVHTRPTLASHARAPRRRCPHRAAGTTTCRTPPLPPCHHITLRSPTSKSDRAPPQRRTSTRARDERCCPLLPSLFLFSVFKIHKMQFSYRMQLLIFILRMQ